MEPVQLKKILRVLQGMKQNSRGFFKNQPDKRISDKTIDNAFNSDKGINAATADFFGRYISESGPDFSYQCLDAQLRAFLEEGGKDANQCAREFAEALEKGSSTEHDEMLNEGNYIGRLQDQNLPFHKAGAQVDFYQKLNRSVQSALGIPSVQIKGIEGCFDLSFVDVARVAGPLSHVKCVFGGAETPPEPSTSRFAEKVKKQGAFDNPSFGLREFVSDEKSGRLTIKLEWNTYLRSLESCDSRYMETIYAYGTPNEEKTIKNLAATAAHIFKHKGGGSLPILGVTTAIIFRRDNFGGPYWTLVQLKQGKGSNIAESHLTPSFVHQPATKMRHSLRAEAGDIEFHVKRELAEEIFDFPENAHTDYEYYKKIVNQHHAIQSLDDLMKAGKAQLWCYGLIFDIHRAKFELVNVLRIDDPGWFDQVAEKIKANHEAIPSGVVLAPLNAQGIHQALHGELTYTQPVRRLCSPAQSALWAGIEHLQSLEDPHVKDIRLVKSASSAYAAIAGSYSIHSNPPGSQSSWA